MLNIPISALPLQSFSIRLDDDFYDIVIRLCAASSRVAPFYRAGVITMDIIRNQTPIVLGQRCVVGTPVIPYAYLATGNFMWVVDDNELLDYTKFGVNQFLIYASPIELEDINQNLTILEES